MPARPTLAAIRDRIAERGGELRKLMKAKALSARFGALSEEGKLTRVPRGYDKEHEHAELQRHASFTVSAPIDDAMATSPKLAQQVEKDFKAMAPLVRWINDALGYPPAEHR